MKRDITGLRSLAEEQNWRAAAAPKGAGRKPETGSQRPEVSPLPFSARRFQGSTCLAAGVVLRFYLRIPFSARAASGLREAAA